MTTQIKLFVGKRHSGHWVEKSAIRPCAAIAQCKSRRSVPGISQKTLTQCLRQLERSGLVERRVLTDSPLGVEYSFTRLGDTLETPIRALNNWTRQYSAAVRTAQGAYDADRRGKESRLAKRLLQAR